MKVCQLVLFLALSTQALGLYLDAKIASTVHDVNARTNSLPLEFTLTNTHPTLPVVVCVWGTPLDNLEFMTANMFNVTHSTGIQAEYVGILAKRRPTLSDFVTLRPAQTIEASLDLFKGYWFPVEGTYGVALSSQILAHLGSLDLEEVINDGLSAFFPSPISSESITFRVSGVKEAPAWMSVNSTLYGIQADPVTVSCTSAETSSILTADKNGLSISQQTQRYVEGKTCANAPVYKTWMDSGCDATRYKTVTTNYQKITAGFQNARKVDCKGSSCSANVYAYVHPSDKTHTIYVCGVFWQVSVNTCTIDSKPGTLLHELSHFSDIAGTQDWAYGTTNCKNLATSNPARATTNADNYEYFAESCPV